MPYFHGIEVPILQSLSALFGQCPLTFEAGASAASDVDEKPLKGGGGGAPNVCNGKKRCKNLFYHLREVLIEKRIACEMSDISFEG